MKLSYSVKRYPGLVALALMCIVAFVLVMTAAAPVDVAYAGLAGTPGGPGGGHGKGGGAGPDGTPGAPPDQAGSKALGNFLQREQHVLDSLTQRLDVSAKIAARAQEWIDKQKVAGKDTTSLEAGLAAFNTQVAAAKSDYDQAAGLLQSPAGFDANGNVLDRQQALSTVRQIRDLLHQANMALVKAVPDFRHAVNDFRQASGSQDNEGGHGNQGQGQGDQGKGHGLDTETPEPTEQPGG